MVILSFEINTKCLEKGVKYQVDNNDEFHIELFVDEERQPAVREIRWTKLKGGIDFKQTDIIAGDQILGK